MGLDACVYLAQPRLPADVSRRDVLRDARTGEHYTLPPHPELPRNYIIAIEEHIGNVTFVATLRERLQESGVRYEHLRRFLEHSTASGSVFPMAVAAQMAEEARQLRHEHARDKEVESFCTKVERLATSSQSEHNPIVLV